MGEVPKSFLYPWCGKNKIIPKYEVKSAGNKQRKRFLCETAVVQGEQSANLPGGPVAPHIQLSSSNQNYPIRNNYAPFNQTSTPYFISRVEEQRRTEEAEDLDINSSIHGNWTLDNAKSRLHQFFQQNKINPEYKYSPVGPDHNRSFMCELNVYVKDLGRAINAKEHGSNKQMASKSCALSLIRQLYHLQVIEAHTGVTKNKESDETAVVQGEQSANLPEGGPVAPHIQLSSSYQNYPIRNNYAPFNQTSTPDFISRVEEQRRTEEAEDLDINSSTHGNWTLDNAKSRLHQFFQQNKINPEYKYSPVGPDNNRSFMCELNVYVKDLGRAINAKEHGSNKQMASKSCALSLIRQLYHLQVIEAHTGVTKNKESDETAVVQGEQSANLPEGGPVAPHIQLSSSNQNYPIRNNYAPFNQTSTPDFISRVEEQRRTEEAEDLDINSSTHGNWTLDNAKSRLHQFFQQNKINPEYKYSPVGPDNNRSFMCELNVYVKDLGRAINAKEHGSNKQMASKSCALSLIRQLYHLQVIEAHTGVTKNKESDEVHQCIIGTAQKRKK